jgi:mannitol 2-dehydrogenase
MSFIVGLSTIATVIVAFAPCPAAVLAGADEADPAAALVALDDDELSPPHALATTAPTRAALTTTVRRLELRSPIFIARPPFVRGAREDPDVAPRLRCRCCSWLCLCLSRDRCWFMLATRIEGCGELTRMAVHSVSDPKRPAVRLGRDTLARVAARLPVPHYDLDAAPRGIVHIGVGGFHRSHLAAYVHELLESGRMFDRIVGAGLLSSDRRMAETLQAQDGLYTLIERDGNEARAAIVGAIGRYLYAADDAHPLLQIMADPGTRIVSLTITEGGYPVHAGDFVETARLHEEAGAECPSSVFGVVAGALDARWRAGLPPFTVMSCDNLPGNGDVARLATVGAAALRSTALARWVDDTGAFPCSMVDRITPATTDDDREFVRREYGIDDEWPVACEPFRQWVLEDSFCDGRPPFEDAGVVLTTDVEPYERMKLRLLNGSHSGLAYHAALAGFQRVDEAMAEPAFERFVRTLMRAEVAPNLVPPRGIDLTSYQDEVVHRFSNTAIRDQVARVCADGSSKFPTFVVPSVEAQLARGRAVRMLALVLAGWCRYLRGHADDGSPLELAHDPFLTEAVAAAEEARHEPRRFLRYERAFGPRLAESDQLVDTFSAALASLEQMGSLATLAAWTS